MKRKVSATVAPAESESRANRGAGNTGNRQYYGTSEAALKLFAAHANKTSLHPLDWEHFYRFIVSAHQFRKGWNHNDVRRLLEELGFDGEKARTLGEVYWHGRCSLYISKHLEGGARYAGWVRKGRDLMI